MNDNRIEPPEVVRLVEDYADKERSDAVKFSNRTPLDESGIWSLHTLAARIYAMGWEGGEYAERERGRGVHLRRDRSAPTTAAGDDGEGVGA